jgi:hypothetical protein
MKRILLNYDFFGCLDIAQLDTTKETECVIQVTSSNPVGGVKV